MTSIRKAPRTDPAFVKHAFTIGRVYLQRDQCLCRRRPELRRIAASSGGLGRGHLLRERHIRPNKTNMTLSALHPR